MRPSTGGSPSRKRDGGGTSAKSDLGLFSENHQPDAENCCSQKQANMMTTARVAPRHPGRLFRQAHHTTDSSKSVYASLASATRSVGNVITHVLTGQPARQINTAGAATQHASSSAPIMLSSHRRDALTTLSSGARVKNFAATSHPKAASID